MVDPAFLSARVLARRIRSGALSAADALEMYVERQQHLNPRLNAIIATDLANARKTARATDRLIKRGSNPGPLAGVPVTVKESYDYAGLPTTWGLERHKNNIARQHAVAVQRLLDAGATVWGKTNVPVLLADWQTHNPVYGTTHNPWDTSRTPGGSSGGAAAALAAGLTGLDYGSDIGGSIRGPAHYCGIYGHKTTYGIVPTRGHALPETWAPTDMSVLGPLARSAADLEVALRVTAGPDVADHAAYRLKLPAASFRDFEGFESRVRSSRAFPPAARSPGPSTTSPNSSANAGQRLIGKRSYPTPPPNTIVCMCCCAVQRLQCAPMTMLPSPFCCSKMTHWILQIAVIRPSRFVAIPCFTATGCA